LKKYYLKIGQTVFLILVCLVSVVFADGYESVLTSAKDDDLPTVIIDPGHGGFDGGAVADDGTVEKNINLVISLNLAQLLESNGYRVILTRDTDISTDTIGQESIGKRKKNDLQNRLLLMDKYPNAVFVSIHLNKFTTGAARGSQVFFGGKNENSQVLGEFIQKSIREKLQSENTRVIKKATSGTYILYNAPIPAVLLECGFLSNKTELEMLKNADYQRQIAFCAFCGINDYFNYKGENRDVVKS